MNGCFLGKPATSSGMHITHKTHYLLCAVACTGVTCILE